MVIAVSNDKINYHNLSVHAIGPLLINHQGHIKPSFERDDQSISKEL